jgi:hypothetical protein
MKYCCYRIAVTEGMENKVWFLKISHRLRFTPAAACTACSSFDYDGELSLDWCCSAKM